MRSWSFKGRGMAWLLLWGLWFMGLQAPAHPLELDPNPEPTAAVDVQSKRLGFTAKVELSRNLDPVAAQEMAYHIAELEGLYQLALSSKDPQIEEGRVTWDVQAGGCKYLGWLAQSQFYRQTLSSKTVAANVNNITWLNYSSNPQQLADRLLYKGDFDKDGVEETIYLNPDTSLTVKRGQRVIGALYPLGSFQAMRLEPQVTSQVALPSSNFISYTSVKTVQEVKLQGDKLYLEVVTLERESNFGVWASQQTKRRAYTLQIARGERSPFVNIVEPQGDRVANPQQVNFKGQIEAPAGLLRANLQLNGRSLWQSPVGLKSDKLEIDLCLDLQPGVNTMAIEVRDLEGRKFIKEIKLYATPPTKERQVRALLVGANSGADKTGEERIQKVRSLFLERGYSVKTLAGAEASLAKIEAGLAHLARESAPSDLVLLYLVGPGRPAAEGWNFVSSDRKNLTPQMLSDFYKRLPGARWALLWDTVGENPSLNGLGGQEGLFSRQLDGRYCTALLGQNLSAPFLENLQASSGDLFRAVRATYPLLCSREFQRANSERRPPQLPVFLTF